MIYELGGECREPCKEKSIFKTIPKAFLRDFIRQGFPLERLHQGLFYGFVFHGKELRKPQALESSRDSEGDSCP